MKRLLQQRYVLRQNLLTIIGLCLCVYFSYHTLLGERSYISLLSLERQAEGVSKEYQTLHEQRVELEKKVVSLRPGSLDKDFLEERARYVLGYAYEDEKILLDADI